MSLVVIALVSGLLLAPVQVARAEVRFEVIDLGTLGGTQASAFALNDADPVQVVGKTFTQTSLERAFLWENGSMTNLGTLFPNHQFPSSRAWGINDDGNIVGDSLSHAFIWEPNSGGGGTMTELGAPSSENCALNAHAQDINESGEVAGIAIIERVLETWPFYYCPYQPYWWDQFQAGHQHETGTGPYGGEAQAINDDGWLAGFAAVGAQGKAAIWSPEGTMTLLDTSGCCSSSFARDINNSNVVVFDEGFGSEGSMWSNGVTTPLGSLDDYSSRPHAINDAGQIVGRSGASAFLWEPGTEGGEMLDLNSLIPENSGWTLTTAYDINERGEIVGEGTKNGQTRAFLLTFEGLDPELWDVFALDAPAVTEGGGSGASSIQAATQVTSKFVVKRSEVGDTSTIKYTTKDDTAKAGSDYIAKSGTLTFGEEAKKKTVYVKILNNNKREQTEKFFLVLSKPSDNLQITDKKARATIRDDD